ncbi:MAG: TonB-dependent receptor plug domain-containing protein [Kiritimatiellia bacterium]
MREEWHRPSFIQLALVGLVVLSGWQSRAMAAPTECGAKTNYLFEMQAAEEIVVTAPRAERSLLDKPAAIDLIEIDAAARAVALTADEFLASLAGVDHRGGGVPGGGIDLNLRGLTDGFRSKRLLVLLDGHRLNDAFVGGVDWALIPVENLERVEVFHGPASPTHGPDALSGVVNLVMRKGTEMSRTTFGLSGGSFNTWHGRFSHGRRIGSLDYFVAANRVSTDGYIRNVDGSRRDWLAQNISGNFGWQISSLSDARLQLSLGSSEGADDTSVRSTVKDYQVLQYENRWDEKREAKLHLRLTRGGQRDVYDWKPQGRGVYDQETWSARTVQSLWLGDRNFFTGGIEGRLDRVEVNDVLVTIDKDATILSFFAEDELFLSDLLRFTASIRADCESSYGTAWGPRLGVTIKPARDSLFFLAIARATRTPALSDRYINTVYNNFRFEGNPELNPEVLTAYELGLRTRCGKRLDIAFSLFYNDLEDEFDFLLDPDGVFRIRNVNRVNTYGFEGELRYAFAEGLTGVLSYSRTEGRYRDFPPDPVVEGNDLPYLARDKAAAGLLFGSKRISHVFLVRFVGDRFGDAQNSPEKRMDDYIVFDWRSRISLRDRVYLTLRVDNLFNRVYQELPGVEQSGAWAMIGLDLEI